MNIKEKIYTFVANRQPERCVQWPHWSQTRQVLVLYESDMEENNPTIRTIRTELQRYHIDAFFIGYAPKKEIRSAILPQSQIVGKQSFTCLGYPKKALRAELQQQPYDLVINLSQSNELPLRYLCLLSDASFKAGMRFCDNTPSPCDMQIQTAVQETPIFLFEQIIHYLTHIQSND